MTGRHVLRVLAQSCKTRSQLPSLSVSRLARVVLDDKSKTSQIEFSRTQWPIVPYVRICFAFRTLSKLVGRQ